MTWYAIAISPSSTRPAKVVTLKRGPRNGLRRSVEYSETQFQIEKDLAVSGFNAYVPADIKALKYKTNATEMLRRVPMLRGYAFIRDPKDWQVLEGVKGVCGLLGSGNVPIRIPESDIALLRMAEVECQNSAIAAKEAREARAKRQTRRMTGQSFPSGKKVRVNHPLLGVQQAIIDRATGRGAVLVLFDQLQNLGIVEVPVGLISEIAA